MNVNIIAALDAEIAALERARALLTGVVDQKPATKRRKQKHHMTPEGRARIVAALKKRWAAARKSK
jgi:hypothetical protein